MELSVKQIILVKEKFYKTFAIKLFTIILILFVGIQSSESNEKIKIIDNLKNIETLEFNFIQISPQTREAGICYLKRPHFLRCIYNNENKKELIINRKNLVIYHKKYRKTYFYPVSKSFFSEILNVEKFEKLILNSNLGITDKEIKIKYSGENKGDMIFFFDKQSFNLKGWEIIDVYGNQTSFQIDIVDKNINLSKKLFLIPEIN